MGDGEFGKMAFGSGEQPKTNYFNNFNNLGVQGKAE
jgi:hypothetical protein